MKIKSISFHKVILLVFVSLVISSCETKESNIIKISDNLSFIQGDINGALIKSGDNNLVIYGDPENAIEKADMVLYTHAQRDVAWVGRNLVENGAKAVVPKNEVVYFTNPDSVWISILEHQALDYREKTSRVPTSALPIYKTVKGGDVINWQGIPIKVIDGRGYTEGAVSYVVNIDDIKVAFVGDLIYGDGEILDLYSLQDEILEVGTWGYHGYASRMADVIQSLERISKLNPDILIPTHGPVINNPKVAINKLVKRLRLIYQNYLSINSFRWYKSNGWGDPKDGTDNLAKRVLSPDMTVNWMPFAETRENPKWLKHDVNSKLIVSEDGTAFLVDCGMKKAFDNFMNLEETFSCSNIEGIFISHYHQDHTDYINKIREKYNCPTYITKELKNVLNYPKAYKLPAMTPDPIENLTIVPEGSSITWKEFTFTFYYFPGQTIYHDAILIKNNNTDENIFLTGDSFSPSGIDDYCLQNRNLLGEKLGYIYCINILRELPKDTWLVNQHTAPIFKYTKGQLDFMYNNLKERQTLLDELFPWDNVNFGIDAQWVRVYPYSQVVTNGHSKTEFSVIITNHSNKKQVFNIHPETGDLTCTPKSQTISISAGEDGKVNFKLNIPNNLSKVNKVITVDVSFDKWKLHKWCESIIQFKKS
jgi:glyoxylase-like metal-dependent hydrolase (beta-lactamase superfamily II)